MLTRSSSVISVFREHFESVKAKSIEVALEEAKRLEASVNRNSRTGRRSRSQSAMRDPTTEVAQDELTVDRMFAISTEQGCDPHRTNLSVSRDSKETAI